MQNTKFVICNMEIRELACEHNNYRYAHAWAFICSGYTSFTSKMKVAVLLGRFKEAIDLPTCLPAIIHVISSVYSLLYDNSNS